MKIFFQIFYILLLFNSSLWSLESAEQYSESDFYNQSYSKIIRFDEIYFQNNLADSNLSKVLGPIVLAIKKETSRPHTKVKITLVGHSKHRKTQQDAFDASKAYVLEVYKRLVENNISKNIISKYFQADKAMLYSDETENSNRLSNRVNINMYVNYLTDKDNDGVYSDKDRCPDTKDGEIVDASGCSAKEIVVLIRGHKKKSKIIVSNRVGSVVIEYFNHYTVIGSQDTPPQLPKKISKEKLNKSFMNLVDIPTVNKHYVFYFNGTNILENSKKEFKKMIEDISKIKNPIIKVIGHTDTVKSAHYNEKLGLARAKVIEEMILKSKVKILKIDVLSYGERNLAVPTADNVAQKLNRRVEVFIH